MTNNLDLDGILSTDLELLAQMDEPSANRLPFPALYAFWRNGNTALKKANDASYFGGWAITGEGVNDMGLKLPEDFVLSEYEKNGETKISYIRRVLTVAIFAKRRWWESKDGTKFGSSDKGLSPSAQYLAALKVSQSAQPVPVVLNLSGYQVTYFAEAVQAWEKAIAQNIKALTDQKLGGYAFWTTLGTVGEFATRKVGTGSNTKEINFVSAAIPAEFDSKALKARFVGTELIRQWAGWKQDAKTWLEFYQTQKAAVRTKSAHAESAPEAVPDEEYPF